MTNKICTLYLAWNEIYHVQLRHVEIILRKYLKFLPYHYSHSGQGQDLPADVLASGGVVGVSMVAVPLEHVSMDPADTEAEREAERRNKQQQLRLMAQSDR